MGTASTMACLLVALGMMPLNGATAPAVSSARLRIAEATGSLAVTALAPSPPPSPSQTPNPSHLQQQQPKKDLRPQTILTRSSFHNAITVLQAIGGSTNAAVHLMAIAGRHPDPAISGPDGITPATIDEIGRVTPLLVDLKPSGDNYMTDFHSAGGMPALLHELRKGGLLKPDAMTVTGRTLGDELDHHSHPYKPFKLPEGTPLSHVIHKLDRPLYPASSLVVFSRGNLSPGGSAIIKASASGDRSLLKHRGPAVVFASPADMAERIDAPNLDVTQDSVLVLQHIGPVGKDSPGMPEAGLIPIPRKLAARGVKDMLRVSDGRMSGTAGGSIVLHVSPEAGDPESVLGIVRDGDEIFCDVENRELSVLISDEEIRRRIQERKERFRLAEERGERVESVWETRKGVRGYRGLYMREVNQAERGVDFGFLTAVGPQA